MLQATQEAARVLNLDERSFYLRINRLPPYQHVGHLHRHLVADERAE